jgi:GNAT superfamily N-acetyltransferase
MAQPIPPGHADVTMVRPTLTHLPAWPLPAGYRLRTYRPGDEHAWVALHVDADLYNDVDLDTFARTYGGDMAALADRMFFAETLAGETVGSATAWWIDDWQGSSWGHVHWVVVARAHQGRGIMRGMMTAVLARMARSHTRAMMGTNTARTAAVKVYLDAGFTPWEEELATPELAHGWRLVQAALSKPEVTFST